MPEKTLSKNRAKSWFNASENDLDWARGSLDLKKYAGVCFLSQQVAEKSLKAFLYSKDEDLKKIHDLDKLLSTAMKHKPGFAKFKKVTATLSGYYLTTRYPDIGDIDVFDKEELAKEALSMAEKLHTFVKKNLK